MSKERYVAVESKYTGIDAIKILEEPFSGIVFTFGKVSLNEDEENDKLHINFEYEIQDMGNKEITDMSPFETYIGLILQELLIKGVQDNSLVYTGGSD